MTELALPTNVMLVYLLVFIRYVALVEVSTLFSAVYAPPAYRFFFCALLSMASVSGANLTIPLVLFESWISIFVVVIREFAIGALIGILAFLPLTALHIAGDQTGTVSGLAMASVMDPLSQNQISIIGQMQVFLGFWFYFCWNGHLLIIQSVIESLRLVPPGGLSFFPANDMSIGLWIQETFKLAVRMLIPFYCSILLADIGLGFLARTVPQMNIFVLGLPLRVGLGFLVLLMVLPLIVDILYENMERYIEFALKSVIAFRI
ncbi:MAG: flagellar biosynthetic protein FliR [Synergistaceae bacterium]|nr:flagellar biosynthetic protein FliR [Synergistaceae bacterium]